MTSTARRISGKTVAIVFAIVTVILFALVYSVNARLQAMSEQLRVVRDSWTPVAPLVRDRVEATRQQVQQLGELRNIEVFRYFYQRFMESSLYDDQARALPVLYARAKTFATPKSLQFGELTGEQKEAVDRFIREARKFEALKSGSLGKITVGILQLDYPPSIAEEVAAMQGVASPAEPLPR